MKTRTKKGRGRRLLSLLLVLVMCVSLLNITVLAIDGPDDARALVCDQEESEGHQHTDECYTTTTELTCGLEEGEEHTHTDECYTTTSSLTCGMEESEGHQHTDACYAPVEKTEEPEPTEPEVTEPGEEPAETEPADDPAGTDPADEPAGPVQTIATDDPQGALGDTDEPVTFEDAAAEFTANYITDPVTVDRVIEANAALSHIKQAYGTLIKSTKQAAYEEMHSKYLDILYKIWSVSADDAANYWYFIVSFVDITDVSNPAPIETIQPLAVKLSKQDWPSGTIDQNTMTETLSDSVVRNAHYRYSQAQIANSSVLLSETATARGGAVDLAAKFLMTCLPSSGWEFDAETGTITITETITSLNKQGYPWYSLGNDIKHVIVRGAADAKIDVGANAFYQDYPAIESVELYNVGTVGTNAFAGPTSTPGSIKSLTADGVDELGVMAFAYQALTELNLRNIGKIGTGSFMRCASLTTVHLENIGEIGTQAFASCAALTTVEVTGTCGVIGKNAFNGDKNLTSFIYPEGTKLYYSDAIEGLIDQRIINIIKEDTKLELDPAITGELENLDGLYDVTQTGTTEGNTRVSKSAEWADSNSTTANVGFKFQTDVEQGMDFLFVLDISSSMSDFGSENNLNPRYYDMQSKLYDTVSALLTTEGYNNRAAAIVFNTEATTLFGFTSDFSSVSNTILHPKMPPKGDTNYLSALDLAQSMISNRGETSRQPVIIFISDGEPNIDAQGKAYTPNANDTVNGKYSGRVGTDDWNTNVIGAIKDKATEIKTSGIEICGVLQNVDQESQTYSATAMDALCDYWFASEDTEGFSKAVNNAIGASYGVFTLTDTVGDDFTLDANSIRCSANTEYTVSEDGKTITWTIYALPYTVYELTFQENLNQVNGAYPYGSFDTNEGDAVVATNGNTVNSVKTPTLTRTQPGGGGSGGGTTPTPTPTPDPDPDTPPEDIPDDNPPLEDLPDIPDENPPLSDLLDEDVPTTDLPTTDIPDENPPLAEIPEENVPLDAVPQTGDSSPMALWLALMACSGLGLAVLSIQNKKREDEAQ